MTIGYESMSTVRFEELPDLEAWAALEKITAEHKRVIDEFQRIMEAPKTARKMAPTDGGRPNRTQSRIYRR